MAGELCRNGAVPGRTGLFPQVNRARRLEVRNCRVFPEDHLTSRSATAHIHPALFQRRGAIKLAVVCCRAAASFGEVCRQGRRTSHPGSCDWPLLDRRAEIDLAPLPALDANFVQPAEGVTVGIPVEGIVGWPE